MRLVFPSVQSRGCRPRLIAAFSSNVASNPDVPTDIQERVEVALTGEVSFVAADEVRAGAERAGADDDTVNALVSDYEDAQIDALKLAFLFAALIALVSFLATRRLPTVRFAELEAGSHPPS